MCGIVGYIGENDPKEILLTGLEKLEYRGYDSAGIALNQPNETVVFKEKGRIADLRKVVDPEAKGTAGIGHTRWATHGVPNKINSHPHQSTSKRFTLVHNGVIENYMHIKQERLQAVPFVSETDTEVIVQLIEQYVLAGKETEEAFRLAMAKLEGSYAIAMLDAQNPDMIYVAKNKSPLLVGLGDSCNVVASDAMAMIQVTNQFVELMDKEMVLVEKDRITIKTLDGNVINRTPYMAQIDSSDIEKGTYAHYMLKEIDEQPLIMRKIMHAYQNEQGELDIDKDTLIKVMNADRVYIIACGTSYHAGLIGKQYLEQLAGIPTEVHIASEFVYNMPLLSKNPLFIFISQSGETADSRAVLVAVKNMGHHTLTITNVPGSTLSREADHTLLLHAGPEIAVASTKAYTAQIAVLLLLASAAAMKFGRDIDLQPIQELSKVASIMETLCNAKDKMEELATAYLATTRNAFFIGRNMDYFVCLESALKLKEISYIQTEGFAGGELKHGTIALIEKGTPVFAFVTQPKVNLHIRGNVKEVASRGANTCIISMEGLEQEGDAFVLPAVHPTLTPLISVIPSQLIAYYAALHRDCDVDKPRNLAKSVTVE